LASVHNWLSVNQKVILSCCKCCFWKDWSHGVRRSHSPVN